MKLTAVSILLAGTGIIFFVLLPITCQRRMLPPNVVANSSRANNPSGDGSTRDIYMMVVIDTEGVHASFANGKPSQNADKPSHISNSYAYMVVPKKYAVEKSGTADLHLKAQKGDRLRISAVSESNGYQHDVTVYYMSESEYWTNPQWDFLKGRDIPIPKDEKFTNFHTKNCTFTYLTTTFKKSGGVECEIRFAMYYRERKGLKLFGFVKFNPRIVIGDRPQENPPSPSVPKCSFSLFGRCLWW